MTSSHPHQPSFQVPSRWTLRSRSLGSGRPEERFPASPRRIPRPRSRSLRLRPEDLEESLEGPRRLRPARDRALAEGEAVLARAVPASESSKGSRPRSWTSGSSVSSPWSSSSRQDGPGSHPTMEA